MNTIPPAQLQTLIEAAERALLLEHETWSPYRQAGFEYLRRALAPFLTPSHAAPLRHERN